MESQRERRREEGKGEEEEEEEEEENMGTKGSPRASQASWKALGEREEGGEEGGEGEAEAA